MNTLQLDTDTCKVTTLTLNRPAQHNALNRELIAEFTEALQSTATDTRVLLIKGNGKSFCAGADLNWMKASVTLSDAENRQDATALSTLLNMLNTFPAPTIACVHGTAIGGGLGLVSCCDIAIGSSHSVFALSEVRLGLIPATISPYVIAAIGQRAARRYFLTAERFDASVARQIGLLHQVCDPESLDQQTRALTDKLLKGGPTAQTESKQLVADVSGRVVDTQLRDDLSNRLARIRAADEAQEGLASFLEKRPPHW